MYVCPLVYHLSHTPCTKLLIVPRLSRLKKTEGAVLADLRQELQEEKDRCKSLETQVCPSTALPSHLLEISKDEYVCLKGSGGTHHFHANICNCKLAC